MLKLDTIARLAGLGAFGAIGGMCLAYLGFILFTSPGRSSGMDMTLTLVTWISIGGVLVALIAAHVAIGKQLLRLGKGLDKKHPL